MTTENTTPNSAPNGEPNAEEQKVTAPVALDGAPEPVAKAPGEDQPPEAEGVEYEPTGDPSLDMALQFVGKAGITMAHPGMVAAQTGDFSILKAALAAKGVQGWEQFVALGEQAFERAKANQAAATAKVQALVHDAVGGAEAWAEIQAWASKNAEPDEKAEINKMLAAGGFQAKQAARYLADCYNKANDTVIEPADPTRRASRETERSDNSPLSPRQYSDAVAALNVKLRGNMESSPEYARLNARRLAYRG